MEYFSAENCFNDYSFYDFFTSQIPFDIYLSVSYINRFEIIGKACKTQDNMSIAFLTILTCTTAQTPVQYLNGSLLKMDITSHYHIRLCTMTF